MKKHLPFIILCFILAIYLGLKTLPENGWGGWCGGECDAQTLLSSEHWVKDGFIYSKFLFIPIGYSKIVRYLDEPEMRHHAQGTVTGELIGKRLYYTHYPSGYLIPYAFLMKLGVVQRHWFRLLALVFSFSSLILFYWFFNLITKNSLLSFLAISYYAISTMFLDYADSLANMPIDDLLRAAILVLSVLAVNTDGVRLRRLQQPTESDSVGAPSAPRWFNLAIWFLFFLLSISSYDSTFFVFIWLVGLDVIMYLSSSFVIARRSEATTKQSQGLLRSLRSLAMTNVKKWLFFASAPILAFGLQMLQNWWYLGGWKEVWLDMLGAAVAKAYTSNIFSHFANIFYTFYLMTGFKILWAIILVFVLFVILRKLKYFTNFISIFIIFFLAGAIYPFIFISAGRFSYQGRQMVPLIALLVGLATIFIIRVFQNNLLRPKISILLFSSLIAVVIFLWGGQIYRTVQYVYDWPNNKADNNIIQLSKFLRPLNSGDSAIFYQGDRLPASSIMEYYFDMPIFSFEKEEELVKDFLWLKKHSQYPFNAIIMTDREESSNALRQLLIGQKIDKIGNSKFIQGEYIFKVFP